MKIGVKSASLIWAVIFYHLAFQPPYAGFPINPAALIGLALAGYLTFNVRRVIFSDYRKPFILTILVVGLVFCLGCYHYFGNRSLLMLYNLVRLLLLAIIPVYAFIAFAIKSRLPMSPLIKNAFVFMVGIQFLACIAMIAFPPLKQIVFMHLFEYDDLKELRIALSGLRISGFGQAFLFGAPVTVSFLGAVLVMLGLEERRYLMLITGVTAIVFAAFNARIGIALFGLTLLPLFPYYFFKRFGVTVFGGILTAGFISLVLWFSLQTDQGYEIAQWIMKAFVAESAVTESHLTLYSRFLFSTSYLPSGFDFLIGDGSSAFRGTSLNIEASTDSGYSGIFYAGGLLYFICGILFYAIHATRPWKSSLPSKLLILGFAVAMSVIIFKGNALFMSGLLLSFMLFCLVESDNGRLSSALRPRYKLAEGQHKRRR